MKNGERRTHATLAAVAVSLASLPLLLARVCPSVHVCPTSTPPPVANAHLHSHSREAACQRHPSRGRDAGVARCASARLATPGGARGREGSVRQSPSLHTQIKCKHLQTQAAARLALLPVCVCVASVSVSLADQEREREKARENCFAAFCACVSGATAAATWTAAFHSLPRFACENDLRG